MATKFPNIRFSISASDELSVETKAEIIQRAQHVVNRVQIRQLSDIIHLIDKVLSDPQKSYFIVIDRLARISHQKD